MRSPDAGRRLSARFISMSLKTSKYSLGGALCCCRVQPSPQTRSFPRPSRFDRTTILRCLEGLLYRFDRAADPEAERLGPGEEPIDFVNTSLIECLHSLRLSVRSPR